MFKSEFIIEVIEAFRKAEGNRIMVATDAEFYYIEKDYFNEKKYYYCEELGVVSPKFFNLLNFAEHMYSLLELKNIRILGIYY